MTVIIILMLMAVQSPPARRLLRLIWQERDGQIDLGSDLDLFEDDD